MNSLQRMGIASAIAVLLGYGCADTPAGPRSGDLRIEIDRVELHGPEDSTAVRLWLESASGERIDPPEGTLLSVVSEQRQFSDYGVLATEALERGIVRPAAPGVVQLQARAPGYHSETVTVTVAPDTAVIASITQENALTPGDTLWVRGSGLERIDPTEVYIPEVELERVSASDTLALFVVRSLSAVGCSQVSNRAVAAPAAWILANNITVSVRADEVFPHETISLMPGEHHVFEGDTCLRLGPADGEPEYALIYTDVRPIRAAEHAPEDYAVTSTVDFAFTVIDESQPAGDRVLETVSASTAMTAGTAMAARTEDAYWFSQHGISTNTDSDYFLNRADPWRQGDRFTYEHPLFDDGNAVPGEVLRVVGDYIVLAVLDSHRGNITSAWLQELDAATLPLIQQMQSYLGSAYSVNAPLTTQGAGQVFVLLRTDDYGSVGSGTFRGKAWVVLEVGPSPVFSEHRFLEAFVRIWQQSYVEDRRAEGPYTYSRQVWGSDGAAKFAAEEIARLTRDIPFDADLPLEVILGEEAAGLTWFIGTPTNRGMAPSFRFAEGGANSAWYLRHLTWKLMQHGWSYEQSVREVLRGAYDGWYGIVQRDGVAVRQPYSLHKRLAPVFGPSWDPAQFLIEGAAALITDNRTTATDLQVPTILNAWDPHMRPLAVFKAGSNEWLEALVFAHAFGHVKLTGYSAGGTLSVSSGDLESLWALVRVR